MDAESDAMDAVAGRVIECDAERFERDLNVLPYAIGHTLAGHPLFTLEALAELARKVATRNNPHMSGGDVYFTEGAIEAGTKPEYFGSAPDKSAEEKSAAAELVKKIEGAQAWVILKHIEREDRLPRSDGAEPWCDALALAGEAGQESIQKDQVVRGDRVYHVAQPRYRISHRP